MGQRGLLMGQRGLELGEKTLRVDSQGSNRPSPFPGHCPSPALTCPKTKEAREADAASKPFICPDLEVGVAVGVGDEVDTTLWVAGPGAGGLGRRGAQAKVEPFQPTLAAFMS